MPVPSRVFSVQMIGVMKNSNCTMLPSSGAMSRYRVERMPNSSDTQIALIAIRNSAGIAAIAVQLIGCGKIAKMIT